MGCRASRVVAPPPLRCPSGEERADDKRAAKKAEEGTELSQWYEVRHQVGHRFVLRLKRCCLAALWHGAILAV